MKKIILTLSILLLGFSGLLAQFSGGNGMSDSPWQIYDMEDLDTLSAYSTYWGDYFIQTADINAPEVSFSPIGNFTNHFTGSYDGDGHTIDGLYFTGNSDYRGLFGFANGANISNLGLTDIDITIGNNFVGGLVGVNFLNSTVTNCYVTGSVTGRYCSGGLVGVNRGTVSNSYSTGSVNGMINLGGLVGLNQSGTVSNSYSTVNVSGSANYIGGLIGRNEYLSTISNCYSTGSVSGTELVGGLLGYNHYGTVSYSYSTGSVSESSFSGGLVGDSTGGTVSYSFWNTTTSGWTTSAGGIGKTTAEMKTQSTFTGWSGSIWYMDAGADFNDGYPYLYWQNPGGTPLPVELSSFTACVNKNDVTLNWTT